MKLRNIFTALTAAALALVGCQKEAEFLDEVQVSKSFVSLDVDGGEASITVTANAEWVFETSDMWPEIIVRDKEGNVTSSTPSWLSIDKVSGGAGETVNHSGVSVISQASFAVTVTSTEPPSTGIATID